MRIFLALLLSASSLFAQADYSTLLLLQNPSSAPSYIIEERFETPANSNSWTRFGTQTWFYDTAPAPLAGTNSVMFSSAGAEAATNITGIGEFYFAYKFHITQPLQQQYTFAARSNSTPMVRVRLTTTGAIQLNHNGVAASSNTGLFTSNTTYYVWGYALKGDIGSANSSGWLKYSTDGTKPATNAVTISNGAFSNLVNQVAVQGYSGGEWIIDNLLVDDEDIGSNP